MGEHYYKDVTSTEAQIFSGAKNEERKDGSTH